MPSFSKISKERLLTCHETLQMLFNKVIDNYDCVVIQGYRDKEAQDKAFAEKKSKLKWPNSKHNKKPSLAVDVVPYINHMISWDPIECKKFAEYVLKVANELGIKITWGGKWKFVDMPHYEL